MFIFKEKLKKLKANLRVWNKDVFGNVQNINDGLLKRITKLDSRDDVSELGEWKEGLF